MLIENPNSAKNSSSENLADKDKHYYEDEYGSTHIVDFSRVLGRGGQGVVYYTQEKDIILKLALKDGNEVVDISDIQKFQNDVHDLLLLQIPADVQIALPLAVLKDKAGYIMRLLSTAKPFGKFAWSPSSADKNRSPEEFVRLMIQDYLNKGSSRQRCVALGKAASVISMLHSRGLVYCDVSDKNLFFIPQKQDNCTVWLIDPDNLDYEKAKGRIAFTPGFGAPELINRRDCCRCVSDCFSFAVLIFKTLYSGQHPFEQQSTDRDDSNDFFEDTELTSGEYSWIYDPSNIEYSDNLFMPLKSIVNDETFNLLDKTFSKEGGLCCPGLRPTIYHFARALMQSADKSLKCPDCGMTIQSEAGKPFICECTPDIKHFPILKIVAYRLTAKGRKSVSEWEYLKECSLSDLEKYDIPSRVFEPFNMRNFDDTFLTVTFTGNSFELSVNSRVDSQIWICVKSHGDDFIKRTSILADISELKKSDNIWLIVRTVQGYSRIISLEIGE